MPWILTGLLAVVVLWLAAGKLLDRPPPGATTRLSILLPRGMQLVPEPVEVAMSPDGRRIVFLAADSTGAQSLYVRDLDALEPSRIPNTELGTCPFWSPDGRHLGFFRGGKLMRVSLAGDRAPQVICDATDGRGGTWNTDDIIVFAPVSAGALYSVPASGGTPTPVTKLDEAGGETAQRFPQFLPGGRDFIYVSIVGTDRMDTRLASLGGGEPITLVSADSKAEYAAPGYLIFERQNSLLAVALDTSNRKVVGEPIALADIAGGERNYFGSMAIRSTANGTIAYIQSEENTRLVWLDRRGKELGTIPIPPDEYDAPTISPDGERVVVRKAHPENGSDLWMIELDRNILTRLTFEPNSNTSPRWSPDDRVLAFGSHREGTRNIYVKSGGGTGPAELLFRTDGVFANPLGWSPDGRMLLVRELKPDTKNDVLVYSLDDQDLRPLLASRFDELSPSLARDGKWIAYVSDESGRPEVYVQPFPGLGSKVQVSQDGTGSRSATTRFLRLLWSPNDDEIVYVGPDSRTLMRVPVSTEPTFRAGRAEALFRLPRGWTSFDSIDNDRFLVCVSNDFTQQITVVTNWSAELDRD